jgi:hypothetical protein
VNAPVGIPAHPEVVQKVADQSLTLLKNEGILPIKTGELGSLVNICVQKYESDPSPSALAAKLEAALPGVRNFILRLEMNPAVYDKIWPDVSEADLVILSLFV